MAITRSQIARQLMQEGGVPRQGYFLGKLVRKIKDDIIPNELKSPAGLAAAAALGSYGLGRMGEGGADRSIIENIIKGGSKAIGGTRNVLFGDPDDDKSRGVFGTAKDILVGDSADKKDSGILGSLLTSRVALPIASGLLAGAFTKDEEDPLYTGQDVGLNLQDIAKLANISDPKTAAAIGLRFSPDVASRKFSPEEMAATYAANQERDFTEQREQAEDGGIMGGLNQKDFDKFLEDMKQRDMGAMQDQILRDFKKYMERKKMIEQMPEAKDGGIMKVKPKKISMEAGQENTLEQIYFDLIDAGMSPDEAAKKAREIYMNMSGGMAEGGMMDMGGMEMDLRGGGFVPMGRAEKADDVPARLSKNEFVFTADAVRAAGGGSVDKGADKMYATMKKLEDRVA
jgi:hypothetical protein